MEQLPTTHTLGLPRETWQRYYDLVAKRRAETLTVDEHSELIALSDKIEQANARRLAHLAELAKLRQTSVGALMKELELETPEYI